MSTTPVTQPGTSDATPPSSPPRIVRISVTEAPKDLLEDGIKQCLESYESLSSTLPADSTNSELLAATEHLIEAYIALQQYNSAEPLLESLVSKLVAEFTLNSPRVRHAMQNLANVYACLGHWSASNNLLEQLSIISKSQYGKEDPRAVEAEDKRAANYLRQSRWTDVHEIMKEIVPLRRQFVAEAKGRGDTEEVKEAEEELYSSLSKMSQALAHLKKYSEAEGLAQEVVEGNARLWGEDHGYTLIAMDNLALVYGLSSRWTQAKILREQILEINERRLGAEHPTTLTTMSNLAYSYSNLAEYPAAEALTKRAISLKTKVLGASAISTLNTRINLADLYLRTTRHLHATQELADIIRVATSTLGEGHAFVQKIWGMLRYFCDLARKAGAEDAAEMATKLEKESDETAAWGARDRAEPKKSVLATYSGGGSYYGSEEDDD